MCEDPFEDIFKAGWKFIQTVLAVLAVVLMFFSLVLFSGCSVFVPHAAKDIPDQPTIWVVSDVDALEYKYGKGLVFYKIVPVNPGGINARTVWIVEYPGAFKVGDQVKFSTLLK